MPTCDILLAAYNGGKFGPALLDSLLAQTYGDFRLLVRDDGSTDDTLAMLQSYRAKFRGRMEILPAGRPTGSAMGNFSLLMEASNANYVLCADIDDVWLPSKVQVTIDLLRAAEAEHGKEVPTFVFTDVIPTDGDLKPLSDSYWRYKKIDPDVGRRLNQSLICPVMLGCASGMNRALVRLATPVPKEATGHDWWAQLVAAALGHVAYSSEPTMYYRLHGSNSSQQKPVGFSHYLRRLDRVGVVRHGLSRRREQAQALLNQFSGTLPENAHRTVADFISIGEEGFLRRRISMIRGGYLYADAPRNVATFLAM